MHKNRSPCQLLPPGLLVHPFEDMVIPPGMTHLQESTEAPPPRPTPEALREQGVRPHQRDENVSLHEQALRLSNVQVLREEAVGGGKVRATFRADIAVCDVINLNWRFYPRSAYEAANRRAEKAMAQGKLTALLEHPGWDDGWKGRLDAIGARWTRLGIEEREIEWPPDSGQTVTKPVVFGEGVFIGTPAGQLVQTLLEDEVFVGISTNGYSSVTWKPFGELGVDDPTGLLDPDMEIPVTGDDLTYLTIDFVSLPANAGGQTYAESGGFAPPPVRHQESQKPPATPPVTPPPSPAPVPEKETSMHPKIKALCERLGKTLEQVKAENQTEYQQALEEIASEQNTLHVEAARVPGLTAQLARVTTERDDARRDLDEERQARVAESRGRMVDAAIEAADMPVVAPYQDGDTTVDLAGDWRAAVLGEAVRAESDAAALALVNRQVAARAHLLGRRQTESARPTVPAPPARGPRLPAGNNDGPDPLTESADPHFLSNGLVGLLRS